MRKEKMTPSANAPVTTTGGSSTEDPQSLPVSIRIFFRITSDILDEVDDDR